MESSYSSSNEVDMNEEKDKYNDKFKHNQKEPDSSNAEMNKTGKERNSRGFRNKRNSKILLDTQENKKNGIKKILKSNKNEEEKNKDVNVMS
jgi:hypothetical protein